MKNLFAFSIKTVWKLIQYIRPLYELVMTIINIIKADKEEDDEEKKEKEE